MVRAKTPTIADIKNSVSLNDARALLSIAVCEVCDFFNVGKNMNDAQIAVTVDLIIGTYWYLKLKEIKYCFRRAMARERVYDRLDGNILLGWLADYDAERTEAAISISEDEDRERFGGENRSDGGTTLSALLEKLKERATAGDAEAAAQIPQIERILGYDKQQQADAHQKELDFQRWKQEVYLKSHKSK